MTEAKSETADDGHSEHDGTLDPQLETDPTCWEVESGSG